MNILKSKKKTYINIALGVALEACAISLFYVPNKIISGGISGISTIIYYTTRFPTGVSYYIINIILLAIGYKFLGFGFVLRTFICSTLVSFFVDVLSGFPPICDDILISALFGGIIDGIGIGLTLIEDASTGGTDVVGRVFQNRFPHFQIGKILLIVNLLIIGVSFIYFNDLNLCLYGVLALYVSSSAIDMLIHRLNVSKIAFVISDFGDVISKHLVKVSSRGVTILEAKGAYTQTDKYMLVCAIKDNEMPFFRKSVLSIDENAFIVFSESQEIVGNGFYMYH